MSEGDGRGVGACVVVDSGEAKDEITGWEELEREFFSDEGGRRLNALVRGVQRLHAESSGGRRLNALVWGLQRLNAESSGEIGREMPALGLSRWSVACLPETVGAIPRGSRYSSCISELRRV